MRQSIQMFDAAVSTNGWNGCLYQCLMPLSVRMRLQIFYAAVCTNICCDCLQEYLVLMFMQMFCVAVCTDIWFWCLHECLIWRCVRMHDKAIRTYWSVRNYIRCSMRKLHVGICPSGNDWWKRDLLVRISLISIILIWIVTLVLRFLTLRINRVFSSPYRYIQK